MGLLQVANRVGTYFVMREKGSGLVRAPQYVDRALTENPSGVALFNQKYGGNWEFLPVPKATYDAVKQVLAWRQTPYIDDPVTKVVRGAGQKITPRLLEIQRLQKASYTRRDVRSIKFDRIDQRTVKRVA